jgi:hypothetical protein
MYAELLLEGFGLLFYLVVHQSHDNLLVVLEVVLDELVELCLANLTFFVLFLLLRENIDTSRVSSFCSLALTLTLSREVSFLLTLRTFFTVRYYLVFM